MVDNSFTLHTGPNCSQSKYRNMLGTSITQDCDVSNLFQERNQGCSVRTKQSFGAASNAKGGGVVAMEWTDETIKMWLFPHDTTPDVSNVAAWRTPDASFSSVHCDIASIFKEHVVLINTTLCGDWAGEKYPLSGCPSTCEYFVDNYPEAFEQAYWAIGSLRVYQA